MASPCRKIGQHHNARRRDIKFRLDPLRALASCLKPTSSAVPTASAKQENNNNNEEQRLDIHDVHSFQCDGSFGLSTISVEHIIWETPTDKKEVGEFRNNNVSANY
jgi:hypothetical protein